MNILASKKLTSLLRGKEIKDILHEEDGISITTSCGMEIFIEEDGEGINGQEITVFNNKGENILKSHPNAY